MDKDFSTPLPNEQLLKLADALGDLRDSLVKASITLNDIATQIPSNRRNEIAIEVERHLSRIRDAHKRDF